MYRHFFKKFSTGSRNAIVGSLKAGTIRTFISLFALSAVFLVHAQESRVVGMRAHSGKMKALLDRATDLYKKEQTSGRDPDFLEAKKLFHQAFEAAPDSDEGATALLWTTIFDLESAQ